MKRRLFLTFFFQLCLMQCWAVEFESILKTSAEVYERERIYHKTPLAWKADNNQWIELPSNIMPLVERGMMTLEILDINESDDKFMREVKWLTRSVIENGLEGVGPFRWDHSGEKYVIFSAEIPENLRNWVALPVNKILMYSLSKNTRTQFQFAADNDGSSHAVSLTIENTSSSPLWIKKLVDIVLVPTGHGKEPKDCLHIERDDNSTVVFDRQYDQIESGQQMVIHYPVDPVFANQLVGVNRILVPICYRLEENGPVNVELLAFHLAIAVD